MPRFQQARDPPNPESELGTRLQTTVTVVGLAMAEVSLPPLLGR